MAASSSTAERGAPNILITGTPGTGKSTMAEALVKATGLRHVDVGALVKEKQLHDGWDEEFQSYTIDEERVSRALVYASSCAHTRSRCVTTHPDSCVCAPRLRVLSAPDMR